VAAVRNSFQRFITEDLTVTGVEPPKELLDGEQRLHRVATTNGRLDFTYEAVVSVEPELLEDKGLDVAPLHELPGYERDWDCAGNGLSHAGRIEDRKRARGSVA